MKNYLCRSDKSLDFYYYGAAQSNAFSSY